MTKRKYPKPKEVDGRFICTLCGKDYGHYTSYCDHYREKHYNQKSPLKKTKEYTGTKKKAKDYIKENYGISEKELERILIAKRRKEAKTINLKIGKTYKFAAIGDTHLCSNHEMLDELKTFYEICKKEGVTDVYHCGDIVAGQKIFRGQEHQVHTFGAENQVDYFVKNYPKVDGITTHFITGNHDYIYYKIAGVDIGHMVEERREDMVYLGPFQADVMWKGIKLIRLMHPDGGLSYARSYKLQKIIEQIPSGEKPRILLAGHYHVSIFMDYRNILSYLVGAFEGQSPYLLRKGISPVIGGWIIKVKMAEDDKDSIVSANSNFIKLKH